MLPFQITNTFRPMAFAFETVHAVESHCAL